MNAATEAPCELCGGMVDLDAIITVRISEADGSESVSEMTEAEARELAGDLAPPVMCDQHEERFVITTDRAQ